MSTTSSESIVSMTLAENVKHLRTERGLTQTELATAIGVSHPRISEIENNQNSNPRLNTISRIAEFFGVSESFLLTPRKFQKRA